MEEQYERVDRKMSRFSVLYQRYSMAQSRKNPVFDATRGQGRVLAVLNMQSEISTKDLAYILGIRAASLNELISKLEKGGYVERFPSPEDGRVKLVRLTEKGKKMNETRGETSIYECLDDDDLASFERCLDKLNSALANEVIDEREKMDMQEWFSNARGHMDEETFRKMAEARFEMFGGTMPDFNDPEAFKKIAEGHNRMFGGAMPGFNDPETFKKMAEERNRMFGGSMPEGFRGGFGFGFGGHDAAVRKDEEA